MRAIAAIALVLLGTNGMILQIQLIEHRQRIDALEGAAPVIEQPVDLRTLNEKVGAPLVLPNKPRVR
jgi:hypothetical protein